MASKAQIADYTAQALRGFAGEPFDGLYTSPMHAAHCVGQWLQETGRPTPTDCRPGRGDTFNVRDMLLRLDWRNVKHPTITRAR